MSDKAIKCTWDRRSHVSILERDDKGGYFAFVEDGEHASWRAWKTTSSGSAAFASDSVGGSEGEAAAVRAIREAGVAIEVTNPGVHERLDSAERKLSAVVRQLARLRDREEARWAEIFANEGKEGDT